MESQTLTSPKNLSGESGNKQQYQSYQPQHQANQQWSYQGQAGFGNMQSMNYTGQTGSPYTMPKDYLVEAIIVTTISFFCCCSPISIVLGIIAIVKANNVRSEFERGYISEAIKNSNSAKNLSIWAAVISVVFYIIFLFFYVLMAILN